MALFIPSLSQAQGVKWVEKLSWSQILQKAKQENKYVFVDCYATWCVPCKAMDKNVYPDEKVGVVINEKFLAVKVQMDRTKNDDEKIKAWYRDAKSLEEQYKIDAYPTFLFFSPDGKLVHRLSAGMNVEAFLDLVSNALDPMTQYYTRLEEFKNGKVDTSVLRELAIATMKLGNKKLATEIADQYFVVLKPTSLNNKEVKEFVNTFSKSEEAKIIARAYINGLKEKSIYTKDNIEFIKNFTSTSTDRGFKIFYNDADKINAVMNAVIPETWDKNDYAQDAVRGIIYNEYFLMPILKPAFDAPSKGKAPNWIKLKADILNKYFKVDAERIVVDAKYIWYRWKQAPEYLSILLERMAILYRDKSLSYKYFEINNFCWELFEKTKDTIILNRAIFWMEKMFAQSENGRKYPNALDTYANLLYKVGRTNEALVWQEKALKTDPTDGNIKEALNKMKNGLPTWP